jgi:hypothetical protein
MTKEELLTALRAAKEGSRELDAEIALFAGWKRRLHEDTGEPIWLGPNIVFWIVEAGLPEFSRSLDAAAAFREWMLPGWAWGLDYDGERYQAYVNGEDDCIYKESARVREPALAIVAAVVAGVIAKEKTDE